VINNKDPEFSWNICLQLCEEGLLAKPTQGDKIRFAPPLIINEKQILESVNMIDKALKKFSV
jgi:ornithine--oxo-acid transaminase